MTRPNYDCKQPNCFTCRMAFHTVEGLTAAVLEEARAVVEAEKQYQDTISHPPAMDTGTEEGDEALSEAHDNNVADDEQDMIASIIRLANAIAELDAFQSKQAA